MRYVYCCCQHLTLASSVAHLQILLFSANLLHPLTFNINMESRPISSSHLRRGLPAGPLPWYFPIITSVGLLVLSNRTVWPTHRHLLQAARNMSLHQCPQLFVTSRSAPYGISMDRSEHFPLTVASLSSDVQSLSASQLHLSAGHINSTVHYGFIPSMW